MTVFDDEMLRQQVVHAGGRRVRASCSRRVGASTDPMAVTDNQGHVHGVAALRIVDASLFPVIPSANVHLTVPMVAEKIADAMLAQH